MDTETLIALVYSLLSSDTPINQAEIIDALAKSNGDASVACALLESNLKKKRKHQNLDGWVQRKKPTRSSETSSERSTSSHPSMGSQTPSSSRSNPISLMSLLRHPSPSKKFPVQLPPVILSTPELVSQRTPCTLHLSILPPELACKLFYTMVDASKHWKRNKWWLFDRVVESPHLTSFFVRQTDSADGDVSWQEAAQYWYNGRPTDPPDSFPPEMEEACKIVETIVNQEMLKRARFSREWGGKKSDDHVWKANVAASNCYQGTKESVGFHSDQLTYLGPYPTIASLSLGTRRNFTLREVVPTDQSGHRKAQTFHIPLPHNSLTIMHASCQERFKHSIPPQPAIDLYRPAFPRTPEGTLEPSNYRINITFRFYRPDFSPATIPRCKCGIPTILRPDMKNRNDGETDRYWWTCYAGAQNDGKGCNFWSIMDMKAEGRGRCFERDRTESPGVP